MIRTTQDILFITWFVQFTTVFTWYGWLTYLIIPAYAIYKYGGIVKNLLGIGAPKHAQEDQEETPEEKKRREKKERKAEREQKRGGVVKYVR